MSDGLVALIHLDGPERVGSAETEGNVGLIDLAVSAQHRNGLAASGGGDGDRGEIAQELTGLVGGVGREQQVAFGRPHADAEHRAVCQHPSLQTIEQVTALAAVDHRFRIGGFEHGGDAGRGQSLRRGLGVDPALFQGLGAEDPHGEERCDADHSEHDERAPSSAECHHRETATHASLGSCQAGCSLLSRCSSAYPGVTLSPRFVAMGRMPT